MIKDLRIHDQILFLLGSTSVVSGIFLTNIFRENIIFLVLFLCIVSIQILYIFRPYLFYILFFLVFFCIGGYLSFERFQDIESTTQLFEQETVFFTREVSIQGTLTEKISENNTGARYILRNLTIGNKIFPAKAGILVTFPESRGREIDQILSFTGGLSLPAGNEAFDYRTYLLLGDAYTTTKTSFPDVVGQGKSPVVSIVVRKTREKLLSIIEDIYP